MVSAFERSSCFQYAYICECIRFSNPPTGISVSENRTVSIEEAMLVRSGCRNPRSITPSVDSMNGLACGCSRVRWMALLTHSHRDNRWEPDRKCHHMFPSCGQVETRNLSPALESLLHLLTICGSGQPMAVWTEVLSNRTIGCEEPL